MKFFFKLLTVVVMGTLIWFSFALWVGLYSVYSYPPSKEHPEGKTLIVNREEGEPMFNSPTIKPAEPPPEEKGNGIGFERSKVTRHPVETRIIVKLPYVKWAYEKSLKTTSAQ